MVNANFDAEKTMGELNGLIDVINEKWEQIVFNMQNRVQSERLPYKKALEYRKAAPPIIKVEEIFVMLVFSVATFGVVLIGYILWLKYGVRPLYYDKNSAELDYLINKEWTPRMKALRENVHLFSSDRELREAYSELDAIDREISKMTIRGRIKEKDKEEWKKMGKVGKVAGLITIGAVAGLAGGIHSAGKNIGKN